MIDRCVLDGSRSGSWIMLIGGTVTGNEMLTGVPSAFTTRGVTR